MSYARDLRQRVRQLREEEEEPRVAKYIISSPEFDSVDVVTAGDNPGAHIVLWKSAEESGSVPTLAEGLVDAALAEMEMEEEEYMHTSLIGKSRSQIAALHEELCAMYQQRGMTPEAAWRAASSSEMGQEIREAYYGAPEEPRTVAKSHEESRGATNPVLSDIQKKAAAIREREAAVGSPLTPAQAYAKAMDENRELVEAFYLVRERQGQ
jgi:hypothetical protein